MADAVIFHIQSLLTAAGVLSRIFFPAGVREPFIEARDASAERLRALLSVTDASPLKPRNLRDRLEHFDERLEEWARSNPKSYIDLNVAEATEMEKERRTVLRLYNPTTREFIFRKERVALFPLVDEAGRVMHAAEHVRKKMTMPWPADSPSSESAGSGAP